MIRNFCLFLFYVLCWRNFYASIFVRAYFVLRGVRTKENLFSKIEVVIVKLFLRRIIWIMEKVVLVLASYEISVRILCTTKCKIVY